MSHPVTWLDYSDNKHEDCQERCQLKEMKGYDTCARAGYCQMLEDEFALNEQLNYQHDEGPNA